MSPQDDLLRQVFLRVPAKSLLRLKLVSPHWRSIISDPRFIRAHVGFKSSADSGGGQSSLCLLQPLSYIEATNPLIVIQVNQVDGAILRTLMGVCDGLVCIRYVAVDDHFPFDYRVYFSIFNPLLRQGVDVLSSRDLWVSKLPPNTPQSYGFCYDQETDDYCMSIFSYMLSGRLKVKIYWFRHQRYIQFTISPPKTPIDIRGAKFSNMSLCYITGNCDVGFHLSRLNVNTRMFDTVLLPNATQYYGLSLIDGLLIVVTRVEGVLGERDKFYIWMLEDNFPAHWTLRATIENDMRLHEARFLAPLCICKDMLLVAVIFPENQWLVHICLKSGNISRLGDPLPVLAGYLESLMDPQVCQAQVLPAHN